MATRSPTCGWRACRSLTTMRRLLRRTVRTAFKTGLVDLALQAVDGTRVGANASGERTFDAKGLKRLLERTEGGHQGVGGAKHHWGRSGVAHSASGACQR